jgi:uncharacterized protein (TIGR02996 family)
VTEDAFLRAIIAEPEEDAHRLVSADWLDENGGSAGAARAEFIRAQVEIERLGGGPRRSELLRRARELFDVHQETWRSQLPRLPGVSWVGYSRGFVYRADVHAWKFYRRHAAVLFDAAPIRFLRLHRITASTSRQLAASPHLGRLLGLELIEATIGDDGAAALAASPHLAGLRSMAIAAPGLSPNRPGGEWFRVGDAGAAALAASPHLGRLEVLTLCHHRIGPEAAGALARRFGRCLYP